MHGLEVEDLKEAAAYAAFDSMVGGSGLALGAEAREIEGPPLNTAHYNVLISTCAKPRRWQEAMELLARMKERDIERDTRTFNALLHVLDRAAKSKLALRLLKMMRTEGVPPDTITFTSAIGACAKAGEAARAFSLLELMREAGVEPNTITYSAAISACEPKGEWLPALRLLSEMKTDGVGIDAITLNAAIGVCAKAGEWARALSLLKDEFEASGLRPDVISFNAALTAHANAAPAAEWERAERLLAEMPGRGVSPDVVSYNALLSAYRSAGEWRCAVELLQRLRRGEIAADAAAAADAGVDIEEYDDEGVDGDEGDHAADPVAGAGGGEGAEEEARAEAEADEADLSEQIAALAAAAGLKLQRPDSPAARALAPDAVSFTTAISACADAAEAELVLELLRQMRQDRVRPNTLTYSKAIAGLEKAGEWRRCCELLQTISDSNLKHNAVTTNRVLRACAAAKQPSAGLLALLPLLEDAKAAALPVPGDAETLQLARQLLAMNDVADAPATREQTDAVRRHLPRLIDQVARDEQRNQAANVAKATPA